MEIFASSQSATHTPQSEQPETIHTLSHYKRSLEIIRLPKGTATSDAQHFLLVRRHDTVNDVIALAIPLQTMTELADQLDGANPNNPSPKALSNQMVIRARFLQPADEYGFRREAPVSYQFMDIPNAVCINLTALADTTTGLNVVGQTERTDFVHINAMVNASITKPEPLIPYNIRHYLSQVAADEYRVRSNSVWSDLNLERGTPAMSVASLLNKMETTRCRIQTLMDQFRVSVNEAKDILTGGMRHNVDNNLSSDMRPVFEDYLGYIDQIDAPSEQEFHDSELRIIDALNAGVISDATFSMLYNDGYDFIAEVAHDFKKLKRSGIEFSLSVPQVDRALITKEIKDLAKAYNDGSLTITKSPMNQNTAISAFEFCNWHHIDKKLSAPDLDM